MTTVNWHLIRRLLIGFIILVLFAIGTAWVLLRGSLPQYDGTIKLPGLLTAVSVERDSLGSVTIRAQNSLDLTRALGYVHAQERFFEIDLMRRRAAGELAELFGSTVLPVDLEARRYRMRARVSAIFQQLPQDQQQLLDAYRDGVNAGINALTIRPFPYLLTRTKPQVWHSEDSLLVVMAMYLTLNEGSMYRELALSTMHASLPISAYRFLTASGGEWDAPLIGTVMDWPRMPSVDELDLQTVDPGLLQHNYKVNQHTPGSNSFAVTGILANGPALVANDMHLELNVPNLWFRTRLIYPDPQHQTKYIDVTGITLPGTPTIVVGSNRHIAWSFTNSYGDFADWVRVVLDPEDSSRYQSADGWKPVATYHEVLQVRNAPDETLVINETEWGPILASDHDNVPLALVWTALQPSAINLELTKLEQAKTSHEAAKIVQRAGVPTQNFIVGDKGGNIAWTIAGKIPLRSRNYDPSLPSSWSAQDTGWYGWLDSIQYPVIYNPPAQLLWTANARTINEGMLEMLGDGGYDLGARAKQIKNSLHKKNKFTSADMLSIQLDNRALFLTRWYQLLQLNIQQAENSYWATKLELALQDWDKQASTNSVAYLVVQTFRNEVIKNILDGFAAAIRQDHPDFELPSLRQVEHAVWILIEQRPQHLLSPNYKSWQDMLHSSAKQVVEGLQLNTENMPSWGDRNMAQIKHPLSSTLPTFISSWLDMPSDLLAGDINMPHVQTPNFGASQRFSVAPSNEEEGYFDMPGGQSGHPLSPYYGSGHANWVTQQPTPFLPGLPDSILWINATN